MTQYIHKSCKFIASKFPSVFYGAKDMIVQKKMKAHLAVRPPRRLLVEEKQ